MAALVGLHESLISGSFKAKVKSRKAMSTMTPEEALFCRLCGTLISCISPKVASCPLCHSERNVKELTALEIRYQSNSEDLSLRLGFEPLVKPKSSKDEKKDDGVQQRAVVNDECPRCHNPQLEYYTRQLRSADEGQTVFYECPKCRYKFAQNM